jgi:hypothetical protein
MKKKSKNVMIKSNWARNILLSMITDTIKDCGIEELPYDKKNHTRTFKITIKEENYDD